MFQTGRSIVFQTGSFLLVIVYIWSRYMRAT